MIEVPVFNREGQQVDRLSVDEQLLGGYVRRALLKQALVMYHANLRQGSARTRGRSQVEGSTRKLYRQKGTGNARVGSIRTNVRRGGGVAFAKGGANWRQRMPQKQRRLARNSAVLAKLKAQDMIVIDELSFEAPRTREFASILRNLQIDRSCLVATEQYDENVYKSLRNVPKIDMLEAGQLNAGEILRHRKLLMTRGALEQVLTPATETAVAGATS